MIIDTLSMVVWWLMFHGTFNLVWLLSLNLPLALLLHNFCFEEDSCYVKLLADYDLHKDDFIIYRKQSKLFQ